MVSVAVEDLPREIVVPQMPSAKPQGKSLQLEPAFSHLRVAGESNSESGEDRLATQAHGFHRGSNPGLETGGAYWAAPAYEGSQIRVSDSLSFTGDPHITTVVRRNHPSLNVGIVRLAQRLWVIVLSKALQSGMLARAALDVESLHEEPESGKPVLRVYLRASAPQALAFWDGLDRDLDAWLGGLKGREREAAISDLALRIHWNA